MWNILTGFMYTYFIINNATVWPPTLLAYASNVDIDCPQDLFKDYMFIGVGESAKIHHPYPYMHVCIAYTPTMMVWNGPQVYNITQKLSLNAKIVDTKLEYWIDNI